MRRFLTISFLSSIFLFQNVFALGMNAKEIIKRVKEKYQTLTSLQANFEQTFKWELAGETQTVKGSIYLMEGNNYRIETDNQMIVTDGETVWTYSKPGSQVIIDLLEKSEENQLPKDLLFKYSEDFKPSLIGEQKLHGRRVYVLQLSPKDEEAFVKSMKIWVDADKFFTSQIEQVDINDNVNTYVVSNIKDDVELNPSFFKFDIPEETEVVDLRESE